MGSRQTVIGERGDPAAPPGSRPWAIAVRDDMASGIHNVDFEATQTQAVRNLIRQHRGWSVLTNADGEPFRSYEELCEAPPPFGFGMSASAIDDMLEARRQRQAQEIAADPKVLPLKPANTAGPGRGKKTPDKIRGLPEKYGTDQTYLVRRLKRDAPEIAAALANGEYRSARAAGIAAGIVKVPTAVQSAEKAFLKLDKRERKAFLKWAATQ